MCKQFYMSGVTVAGATKQAQGDLGRTNIASAKATSANTMHALLRLMANDDIKHGCRMLGMACTPLAEDNFYMQKTMKGEEATIEQMSAWAHWSWLEPLREVFRTGTSWSKLNRCGLPTKRAPKPPGATAAVALQAMVAEDKIMDCIYEKYWSLVFSLVREHSTSFMHYSGSYPCGLAGLEHESAAKVEAARLLFRRHVEAYTRAQRFDLVDVKQLLLKHPLNSTYMKFASKFARASQWNYPGTQWQEHVRVVFRGELSSVMIERGNQTLRDHETRDTCQKLMRHFAAWENLIQAGLIKGYGREEIDASDGSANPPVTFGESVFTPARKPDPKMCHLDLERITKPQDWPSYSAQSQKITYAQQAAVLYLNEQKSFCRAGDLWRVRFLAEGQAVSIQGIDNYLCVLQVLECAALGWPLERVAADSWRLRLETEELQWICCVDWADVKVLFKTCIRSQKYCHNRIWLFPNTKLKRQQQDVYYIVYTMRSNLKRLSSTNKAHFHASLQRHLQQRFAIIAKQIALP